MSPAETDDSIQRKLARLDEAEQEISARRELLHRRIDRLYLSSPLNDEQVTLLDLLEGEEREVSDERRRLHAQINALRAQVGLPRSRDVANTAGADAPNVVAFPDVA